MEINGKRDKSSAESKVINGVTYLPIRMIENLFNINVQWDGESKVVTIDASRIWVDLNNQVKEKAENEQVGSEKPPLLTHSN
jgi:hypothetical protein